MGVRNQSEHEWSDTYALDNPSTACRAESFDGEVFSLFHLRLVVVLHEAYRFPTMDLVWVDRMSAQVFNGLDLV